MIMMKKLLILLVLPMGLLPASAQKLEVTKGEVDCGRVGFESPVTAVFELRNKGNRKLHISDVRVSCGCTQVDYPRTDIAGGATFQVKLTYDAQQMGHFVKTAAIYSNGSETPVYLKMTGVVLEDVQDFTGSYPYQIGDLRIDKTDLEFDDVNRGDHPVIEIHVANVGTRLLRPNLMHLPSYLTATMSPSQLAPGRSGKLTVTLNSMNLHDYGLTQTSIHLAHNPGDKVTAENEIGVSAVLLPSFADMTATQLQNAPIIQLSATQVDFDFGTKSKMKQTILITNNGRTPLSISSLQMFTQGLKVTLDRRELQPGETTKLKVTGYRKQLKGVRTKPRVLMITNDPNKPKVVININVK